MKLRLICITIENLSLVNLLFNVIPYITLQKTIHPRYEFKIYIIDVKDHVLRISKVLLTYLGIIPEILIFLIN